MNNALMQLLSHEGDLLRRRHKSEVIAEYTRRAEAVHGGSSVSSSANVASVSPSTTVGPPEQTTTVNVDKWRALKAKAVWQ